MRLKEQGRRSYLQTDQLREVGMHTVGDVLPIPPMWVAPVAFNTSIKTKGLSHWPLECPVGSIRTFSPRHRIPDSPAPVIALEEVPKNSHRDIHTVLILQTSEMSDSLSPSSVMGKFVRSSSVRDVAPTSLLVGSSNSDFQEFVIVALDIRGESGAVSVRREKG
jgi:hypothetical protein